MDEKDFVEKLLNSGNQLLEAAGKDFSKWSKLKHNKQDLELFLQFNIVHLRFKPTKSNDMKDIVCTSDTQFIKMFSKLKMSEKKKAIKTRNNGIRTKDPKSILTYNLLQDKYNTIPLSSWDIVTFLTISPENIEILDKVTNEMLKRKIIDDIE